MFHFCLKGKFDASHFYAGIRSPEANLHGHTWRVEVFFTSSSLDTHGEFPRVRELQKSLNLILGELDHGCVNSVIQGPAGKTEDNPTSENISRWLFGRFEEYSKRHDCPMPKSVVVSDSENGWFSYSA